MLYVTYTFNVFIIAFDEISANVMLTAENCANECLVHEETRGQIFHVIL